jgi:transposase
VTKATIHQRLADEHGLAASLASLKRYVTANLPEEARRAQVTVLRDTPPPGAEAQIDYGLLGPWTDPSTGRRHRVQAFVMVLPHSRHMFMRPVLVMDQRAWTEAHVAAFTFFGGAPARLIPDNLRTGIGPACPWAVVAGRQGRGWQATRPSSRITLRTSPAPAAMPQRASCAASRRYP